MYCRSRPSQARPGRRLVELQSNLGLGEELELLGLAPSCCLCQDPQTLKNTKNSKCSFRAASTLEHFRRVLVRPWILGTEICSMGKTLRSFKPIFVVLFEAYGALILEAM